MSEANEGASLDKTNEEQSDEVSACHNRADSLIRACEEKTQRAKGTLPLRLMRRFVKIRLKVYNNDRIHTSIGYQTPLEYTKCVLEKRLKWFSIFRT